jgi:hypothetical protein
VGNPGNRWNPKRKFSRLPPARNRWGSLEEGIHGGLKAGSPLENGEFGKEFSFSKGLQRNYFQSNLRRALRIFSSKIPFGFDIFKTSFENFAREVRV